MGKRKKINYLHGRIMILSEQLEVLAGKIYESDSLSEARILANISAGIISKISKSNEKIGILFDL